MNLLLIGRAAIAGQESLTFAQVAALSGTGALGGAAALILDDLAALTGKGALTGTSPINLDSLVNLTGKGTLAGSEQLTFDDIATLVNGAGGALVGTESIVFNNLAALVGKGILTGTETLTLSPTGIITGKGTLTGSAPVTIGDLAALGGIGNVAGAVALNFSNISTLLATGSLAGSEALAFSSAAAAIAKGVLAGTAPLVFTTTLFFDAGLGDVHNAVGYFPSLGSVTIILYHPISGAVIAIDSADCQEIGTTGTYIWDSTKLTTQPIGYQEYAFRMTDGTAFKGGIIQMFDASDTVKLDDIHKSLKLDIDPTKKIVDEVWDETRDDHDILGSFGAQILTVLKFLSLK